jgi:hypothetical protein
MTAPRRRSADACRPDTNVVLEESQRQFAHIGNGDYVMSVFLDQGTSLATATLALYSAFTAAPASRTVSFRSLHGVAEFERPARPVPGMLTMQLDRITVTVQDGRVVRFTKDA